MGNSDSSSAAGAIAPSALARKAFGWLAAGWVSGPLAAFLVILALTLHASQGSDDLAGAGSVIAAAAMMVIFLQFMWPFVLVLLPAAIAFWPAIARAVPFAEQTLLGVALSLGVVSLLIVLGTFGLIWGFGAELNVYVVVVWVYCSLLAPRLVVPSLRPGTFVEPAAA